MSELPDLTYDELALQLEEARRENAQLQAGLDASFRIDTTERDWRATALADVRLALIEALGGEDAVPGGTTLPQMVDALVQLNRFYHRGWADSHVRHQRAKRTLRDRGITTHTTAVSDTDKPDCSRARQDPPAVRWIFDGQHAGVYVYAPILGDKWRRTVVTSHGVRDDTVDHLPPATEPLFSAPDVELALDAYYEERKRVVANARASGELGDFSATSLDELACKLVVTVERWRSGWVSHRPVLIGTRDAYRTRTFTTPGEVCEACSDPDVGRWVPVSFCPLAAALLDQR